MFRSVFAQQQVEGLPALLLVRSHDGAAAQDDAFVGRRELAPDDMRRPHDAERNLGMPLQAAQLAPLGGTVEVDTRPAVPDVADRHAVGAVPGVLHGQKAVLAPPEHAGSLLRGEQAVAATHGGVVVKRFEAHGYRMAIMLRIERSAARRVASSSTISGARFSSVAAMFSSVTIFMYLQLLQPHVSSSGGAGMKSLSG